MFIAFLCVTSFWSVSVVIVILGFFRAWTNIPIGPIYADYLPPERYFLILDNFIYLNLLFFRFPSGFGLFNFLQGATLFGIGPVIGWIRDYTQSYKISFFCLTTSLVTCAFLWTIEMAIVNRRKTRVQKEQQVDVKEQVELKDV